jgi:hypothetical protein
MNKYKLFVVVVAVLALGGGGTALASGSPVLNMDAQCSVQAGSGLAVCQVTVVSVGAMGQVKVETATGVVNAGDVGADDRPEPGAPMYMTSGSDDGETVVWGT